MFSGRAVAEKDRGVLGEVFEDLLWRIHRAQTTKDHAPFLLELRAGLGSESGLSRLGLAILCDALQRVGSKRADLKVLTNLLLSHIYRDYASSHPKSVYACTPRVPPEIQLKSVRHCGREGDDSHVFDQVCKHFGNMSTGRKAKFVAEQVLKDSRLCGRALQRLDDVPASLVECIIEGVGPFHLNKRMEKYTVLERRRASEEQQEEKLKQVSSKWRKISKVDRKELCSAAEALRWLSDAEGSQEIVKIAAADDKCRARVLALALNCITTPEAYEEHLQMLRLRAKELHYSSDEGSDAASS